jgi:hypothetical protein
MSEFIAAHMWPGAQIERSVLGTHDPDRIWARALAVCPDAVECFAYRASIGVLFGLRLRDGTRVALKIHGERSDDAYLEAVQRVQAHLLDCGFPCPAPLGVRPRATLEAWDDGGTYRDAHEPEVRRVMAEHLDRLHRLTAALLPLEGLAPAPAPANPPLWPKPHNALFDFESTAAGAEWIDEIARAAKDRRDAAPGRLVIGHGDWTAMHFRFDGLRPTVVYDWDSVKCDYETTFVGFAAATFTYTEHLPVELWPSAAEARAFLEDYEGARGMRFAEAEHRAVQAAAVYSRAYSTRCAHAVGKDTAVMRLSEYAAEFL